MDIYFIRHGQTDGNVARRHQHPNIELNEMGKLQAAAIAKDIKRLSPTHIITSTNVRAVETATKIGLACDLIPETYPAFEELHRPTYLIGRHLYGSHSLKFIFGWWLGMPEATMHDGEDYTAFLARLALAREHLAAMPESAKVVIVSHAVFISFFIEHMENEKRMGFFRALRRFIKMYHIKNTSVTHVVYDSKRTPAWRVKRSF